MQKHLIPLVALALSACGTGQRSAPSDEELTQASHRARATAMEQQANVDQIHAEMTTLQVHGAENPTKMNMLIASCQAALGVSMEGEGAYSITKCVNRRWNEAER